MFVVDRHLVPAQCHLSVPHHNEGGRHGKDCQTRDRIVVYMSIWNKMCHFKE